jgi:hypothetical protein
MTDKVQGQPSQHKPFRVRRDADGSDILASSDTLEEAIAGCSATAQRLALCHSGNLDDRMPKDRAKG